MIVLGGICFLYCFFLLFLVYGQGKVKAPEIFNPSKTTGFSIVIPFRNEAENLPRLLESLTGLDYPTALFEILLVDDDSRDSSVELCREFQNRHQELDVKVFSSVRKSASPKKDAITTAVEMSNFEFIVTTDADCKLPALWLSVLNNEIKAKGANMLVGPVSLSSEGRNGNNGFLQLFQELDVLSLQGATMGGFGVNMPFLCNAANLCYEKKHFLQVGGFEGNSHIASGDDVFLLEKFKAKGLKLLYLKHKDALVTTRPQPTWKGLVSQRVRWAAKASNLKPSFGKWIGFLVFAMNLALVVGFFVMLGGALPARSFFILFLVKFNVDFLLVYRSAAFFGRENTLKGYLWCGGFYPFFSTYVALKSLFTGYLWKERFFRK